MFAYWLTFFFGGDQKIFFCEREIFPERATFDVVDPDGTCARYATASGALEIWRLRLRLLQYTRQRRDIQWFLPPSVLFSVILYSRADCIIYNNLPPLSVLTLLNSSSENSSSLKPLNDMHEAMH